jgi:hypothetical protein
MGWGDHRGEDDYVVLDQGRSVGRIYKEIGWELQVLLVDQHEPYPAPPAAQWRDQNFRRGKARIQNPLWRRSCVIVKRASTFNEHIAEDGPTAFAHACRLGAEGIVSKKVDSTK